MQRANALLGVIDRIYSAAVNPEEWEPALEAITELFVAEHTTLVALQNAAPTLVVADRVERDRLARLLWAGANGLLGPVGLAQVPLGQIKTRSEMVSDREFLRSDYFNEFIRPVRSFDSAFSRQEAASALVNVAVCRQQAGGRFTPDDLVLLRALLPHLRNAVELHHRLRAADVQSRDFVRLLDRLGTGVILADGAARPIYVNARAQRVIAENDGLTIDRGGLAASGAAATRRLRAALRDLDGPPAAPGGYGNGNGALATAERCVRIRIERPSLRPPLLLSLVPFTNIAGNGFAAHGAAVPRIAIFIDAVDAPPAVNREAAADVFALTRREADVAAMIARGYAPGEAAQRLSLSVATVRNHLKRVFDKTGAHSQAALVALIRGLKAPH
jgi:DNA-binding CsgD family transcriptional regulator